METKGEPRGIRVEQSPSATDTKNNKIDTQNLDEIPYDPVRKPVRNKAEIEEGVRQGFARLKQRYNEQRLSAQASKSLAATSSNNPSNARLNQDDEEDGLMFRMEY